jgi:hypothetical protein
VASSAHRENANSATTLWQDAKAARRARRTKIDLINMQWMAYDEPAKDVKVNLLDGSAVPTVEDVLADAGLNADDDINLIFA